MTACTCYVLPHTDDCAALVGITIDGARVYRRSTKAVVRNPLLALPAAVKLQQLLALPQNREVGLTIRALLTEMAGAARVTAEKSWRDRKAPMATYWQCVSVYAKHTRKLTPKG